MESMDLKSKGMQGCNGIFWGGMLIEYDSMLLSVYHPDILIPSPIGLNLRVQAQKGTIFIIETKNDVLPKEKPGKSAKKKHGMSKDPEDPPVFCLKWEFNKSGGPAKGFHQLQVIFTRIYQLNHPKCPRIFHRPWYKESAAEPMMPNFPGIGSLRFGIPTLTLDPFGAFHSHTGTLW